MKAMEFQTALSADQTLSVPGNIADAIPQGQSIRVLILIPESETDQEWEQLSATDFGLGYADNDAIYDQLSGR